MAGRFSTAKRVRAALVVMPTLPIIRVRRLLILAHLGPLAARNGMPQRSLALRVADAYSADWAIESQTELAYHALMNGRRTTSGTD